MQINADLMINPNYRYINTEHRSLEKMANFNREAAQAFSKYIHINLIPIQFNKTMP